MASIRPLLCGLLAAAAAGPLGAQSLVPRQPVELSPQLGGAAGAPSLVLAPDFAFVAWSNLDSGVGQVWCSRSSGRAVLWGPPARVDTDTSGAVKVTESDSVQRVGQNVYVFWIDARNGSNTEDVYFNRSTDGGQTFDASDRRLPDGLGGPGEVRAFRAAAVPGPGGDVLYVALRVAPSGAVDEELYLLRSLDGGATWSTPLKLAGDTAGGLDVDQFAIAASGSRVHVVWEDDSTNGAGRYSLYHVRSGDHGATFSAPVRLDATDTNDAGNCDAPGEHGLALRVDGQDVAVAWLEERTHPSNEEARLALSVDGGATFAPDERVGAGDPNTVDVDYLDLWLCKGQLLVALTDNRVGLGSLDHLYVWRRAVQGGTAQETQVSGSDGGAFPRFAGTGSQVVLSWLTDSSVRQSLLARPSDNLGASWLPTTVLHDSGNQRDVDAATIAFDPAYDNAVAAYLLDSGAFGQNRAHVGGVRTPTLLPQGFASGAPFVGFRGENLLESGDLLLVVVVALSQAEGVFLLPDSRDTGLAYDVLTNAGLTLLPSLMAPIQPNGVANTPQLTNSLPPGLSFSAVGVTLDGLGLTRRVTDARTVTVGP